MTHFLLFLYTKYISQSNRISPTKLTLNTISKFRFTQPIKQMKKENLAPLQNGEKAADNLQNKISAEGISYDLKVITYSIPFEEITSAYKNGQWVSFREWLQREEQKRKWTSKGYETARKYLEGLFRTDGVTEEILLCDIKFLIRDINNQIKEEPDLEELWVEMSDWLKEKQANGAVAVILDGQNRLKYALTPFRYNKLAISLFYGGEQRVNVFYKTLNDAARNQINNHRFRISVVISGDVTKVVEKIIAINEGEPWGEHEKRDIRWTTVSFKISRISREPLIQKLHKTDLKKIWTGNYSLEKKGETLFIAELLHFVKYGNKGNDRSLDDMYYAKEATIVRQLKTIDALLKLVSRNFPLKEITENFTKEIYRDLLIYLSMLTNPQDVQSSGRLCYNFKLSQIKNPKLLMERIIKRIKEKLADTDQIQPFLKGGGPLTDDEVKKLIKEGKEGIIKWSNTNAKKGTYLAHHSGSERTDLYARQTLFVNDLNEIIDECLEDGTLITTDARSISKRDRLLAEMKYKGDVFGSREPENLDSTRFKELDHFIPIPQGGTADMDNLNYISKVNNRRKSSHFIDLNDND